MIAHIERRGGRRNMGVGAAPTDRHRPVQLFDE
jgi:hypothetical protein